MDHGKEVKSWPCEVVDFSEVKEYERNPRSMGKTERSGLSATIGKFGYVDRITWNRRTKNIVGGHQTFKDLVERGIESAEMVVVDMSQDEEIAANLVLNNPEIEGEFTEEALGLLEKLDMDGDGFFEDGNLSMLRDSLEEMNGRKGKDSYGDGNREIEMDELSEDFDTKCPHCDFEWDVKADDVEVVLEDEL